MFYLYIVTDRVVSTCRFDSVTEAQDYIKALSIPRWFISNLENEVVEISLRSPE